MQTELLAIAISVLSPVIVVAATWGRLKAKQEAVEVLTEKNATKINDMSNAIGAVKIDLYKQQQIAYDTFVTLKQFESYIQQAREEQHEVRDDVKKLLRLVGKLMPDGD